eukprot:bmy_11705T0
MALLFTRRNVMWREEMGKDGGGGESLLKSNITVHGPSESLVVCDVAEDLVEKLRKFRFRKETNNAAIIMKIDKDKRLVVLDEELEYQHDDGRVSYPLCFIFSSPVGCKPEQQMMYAGSKNKLVQTAELTKVVFEIRNTEDLTEEWLREKLGFFH